MFKDYNKSLFCNKDEKYAFAIEAEISSEFSNRVIKPFYTDISSESSNIYELYGVHNYNEEIRLKLHDLIRDYYADKLPVGSDDNLSGGVHFHLFGNFSNLQNKYQEIKEVMLNCPLFCKIKDNKFYSRDIHSRAEFNDNETWIGNDDKHSFICSKRGCFNNVGVMPFEFRCNNVFDGRILGYYQGVILAVREGIELHKISDTLRNYVKRGDTNYYYGYNTYDEKMDLSLDEVIGGEINGKDLIIIRKNIKKILDLLKKEGLTKSADALKEYLNEYGIMYI